MGGLSISNEEMQSIFLAAVQAKQIFSCASLAVNLVVQLFAYTGLIADLLSLFVSLLSIWLCNRKQQNTSNIKGKKNQCLFSYFRGQKHVLDYFPFLYVCNLPAKFPNIRSVFVNRVGVGIR